MAKRTSKKKTRPNDFEANKYDKIIKENIEQLVPTILRVILKIQVFKIENLPAAKTQTTKEAEADFIKKVYTPEHPDGCIVQIEFEAKDEPETDPKMLYYVAAEFLRYSLPVDLQMVYLLEEKPKNITGKISFFGLSFTYPVHSIYSISFREFIYSDQPEEVILSILANPDGQSKEEVIRMILERLVQLKGKNRALYKFINQLKILSMLRNLRAETVKQIKEMVITKDIVRQIQEDEMYQLGILEGTEKGIVQGIEKGFEQGMEKGIEQGIERGIEKGIEEGRLEQVIFGIRNMTQKTISVSVIADLLGVTETFVLDVQRQLKKEAQIAALLSTTRLSNLQIAKRLKVSHLLVQVIKESNRAAG